LFTETLEENMALELRKRVFELLSSKPDTRFKASDIAKWICKTYPHEAEAKLKSSTFLKSKPELIKQLVAEIGSSRPSWQDSYPELRTSEERPRLYYWTSKTEQDEVVEAEAQEANIPSGQAGQKPTERDLYPALIEFLAAERKIHGFRIDERRSSNASSSGSNRWLYPDVVGIENLAAGLNPEVVAAIKESSERKVRLWSLEVKILINRSNVRETYYQAVSNSSWANFGYLVAAQIDGTDTMQELRILYGMHGIGLIKLDREDPTESEILIPARERTEVEWAMCSRLANENPDFRTFVKKVRQFFQTGDL
jgi:hypothetical protein